MENSASQTRDRPQSDGEKEGKKLWITESEWKHKQKQKRKNIFRFYFWILMLSLFTHSLTRSHTQTSLPLSSFSASNSLFFVSSFSLLFIFIFLICCSNGIVIDFFCLLLSRFDLICLSLVLKFVLFSCILECLMVISKCGWI